eukprot:4707218-Alexandrium_andersonii.AAC.1
MQPWNATSIRLTQQDACWAYQSNRVAGGRFVLQHFSSSGARHQAVLTNWVLAGFPRAAVRRWVCREGGGRGF